MAEKIDEEETVVYHTQMRLMKDGEEVKKWNWCCGNGHQDYAEAVQCHELIAKMVAGTCIPKTQEEAISLQRILALKDTGGDLETRLVKHTVVQTLQLMGGGEILGKAN